MPRREDIGLGQAEEQVRDFLNERGWFPRDRAGRFYTLAHTMEELGEVSRCVTLLETRRSKIAGIDPEKAREMLRMELGDLLYQVLKLGLAYRVDVAESFERVMEKNRRKFPKAVR